MQKEADLAASIEEASTWGLQVAAAVVECVVFLAAYNFSYVLVYTSI